MNERLEEDDRTALAKISNSPPRRKTHSYSQQLRTNTAPLQKRHQNLRKHSLDENRILNHHPPTKNNVYYSTTPDSSDDDEFYPYSTVTSNNAVGSVRDHNVDHYQSQRIEGASECDDPQQPLPEFMGGGGGVGIFKAPSRAPVNPNRPPCLELRPHPLRETQVHLHI